jgi:hypothetical protein
MIKRQKVERESLRKALTLTQAVFTGLGFTAPRSEKLKFAWHTLLLTLAACWSFLITL